MTRWASNYLTGTDATTILSAVARLLQQYATLVAFLDVDLPAHAIFDNYRALGIHSTGRFAAFLLSTTFVYLPSVLFVDWVYRRVKFPSPFGPRATFRAFILNSIFSPVIACFFLFCGLFGLTLGLIARLIEFIVAPGPIAVVDAEYVPVGNPAAAAA